MAYPRSQLVEPGTPGAYHCISRCVRRAFLCGRDKYTKRSYEHRRGWIEDRLYELAEIFAIGLYGYAIMNNHAHVVLTVSPETAQRWSADIVAERWVRLFPSKRLEDNAVRRKRIASDPVLVKCYRERLANLSWFMRCLNEPIARRANKEDGVTGRFWQGRFESQALLDERAMLAALTYVDLNPIRAKIAKDLATSKYTSIAERVRQVSSKDVTPTSTLRPLAGVISDLFPTLAVADYIDLADYTGRQWHHAKPGRIAESEPRLLTALGIDAADWTLEVRGIRERYWRAVGAVAALLEKARAMNQQWLCGIGFARELEH